MSMSSTHFLFSSFVAILPIWHLLLTHIPGPAVAFTPSPLGNDMRGCRASDRSSWDSVTSSLIQQQPPRLASLLSPSESVAQFIRPTATTTTTTTRLNMARVRRNDRRPPKVEVKPPMNDEIDAPELRVIAQDSAGKDEPLGIMSKSDALAKAEELGGVDLILINANSDPPVCKIADYSKYRYNLEKKAKETKKKSKAVEIKEVKMSYKIDVHDYQVRRKNAMKFLQQGNRVKCVVQFRGREIQHDKLGFELLDRLAAEMEDICVREGTPKREGRNLSLIMSPRPEVVKKLNESRRAEEKAKKKKKSEAKELKAAAAAAAAATVSTNESVEINGDDNSGVAVSVATAVSTADVIGEDNDDEMLDLEDEIESSLDDLFGSDDLTDDLFS